MPAPPRSGPRRALRLALGLALAASVAGTMWQARALALSWPASALLERSAAGIAATVEAQLARAATPAAVAARLETLLAGTPRDWLAIEAVAEMAAARGIVLPEDLLARRAELQAADHGALVTAGRCAACMWDPAACDFSAILFCRVPVDLTPLGDLAGVIREGGNLWRGRQGDEVDLILSTVGLAAVALVPVTGGAAATVKAGAGLGKIAWRSGRLARGVTVPLRRAAREGVDWARIGAVRTGDDLARLAHPAALRPALALAEDAGRIHRALGLRRGLHVLSRAETPAEARHLARAAEALGPRTPGALEMLGRNRLIRATLRHADAVWALLAAVLAALASLLGLAASAATSAALRQLRRRLR